MISRRFVQKTVPQGKDERIAYYFDSEPWGGAVTPSGIVMTVTDSNGVDKTSTTTSGVATVNGTVITLPLLHTLTAGELYRIDALFVCGGNTFEAFGFVQAEV